MYASVIDDFRIARNKIYRQKLKRCRAVFRNALPTDFSRATVTSADDDGPYFFFYHTNGLGNECCSRRSRVKCVWSEINLTMKK